MLRILRMSKPVLLEAIIVVHLLAVLVLAADELWRLLHLL